VRSWPSAKAAADLHRQPTDRLPTIPTDGPKDIRGIRPGHIAPRSAASHGEVAEWQGHPPEVLQHMKDHIEKLKQQGFGPRMTKVLSL